MASRAPLPESSASEPSGIEDAQPGHVAALRRLAEHQDAVGADAGMGGAEPAHALRGQLEGELALLHDQVVVAERLPLLEGHVAG
jgi:hypothetical protein